MNNLRSPLISIIVPVYNIENYISDCLESVKKQSYTNFECLIIDDCGHDNSIQIAQTLIKNWRYDTRFRIIRRENNGGLSAARNTGIDQSTGDYIYFLDGDDKILPDCLLALVSIVRKYPKVQMVQGNVIYENSKEVWQFNQSDFPEYCDERECIRTLMLRWKIAISSWNKLYLSDYIHKNKLRFCEGIIHEDVKWCWDNQKNLTSIGFCYYRCYWYRTDNQNSIMHNIDKTKSALSFLTIYQLIKNDITDNKELRFVKDYILPYKVSLNRWAFSQNREHIKGKLLDILRNTTIVNLMPRCLMLLVLSYVFPFNTYKRYKL